MKTNFLISKIQKSNRNLIILNLILALIFSFLSVVFIRSLIASLNTTKEIIGSILLVVLFIVLVIFSIIYIKIGIQRNNNPMLHPLIKELSSYGSPEELINLFDKIFNPDNKELFNLSSLYITPNWFFIDDSMIFRLHKVSQIIWVFKTQTTRKINFITTGVYYDLKINMDDGSFCYIQDKEENIDIMIKEISKKAPFAIYGYTDELDKIWSDQKQKLIALVKEKQLIG